MEKLLQDIFYGLRMIRKKPGFSLVAVLTLAIGIGANTAIFSVINGVLLRSLPYKDPDKLVMIWNDYGDEGQSLPAVSALDFQDYQAQSKLFEGFSGAAGGIGQGTSSNLTGDGPPEKVDACSVTANFFPLLGVEPLLGRQFRDDEAKPNGPKIVMISYSLWQRRFNGEPNIIGKTIQLGGRGYEVVAVLPANFTLLLPPERFVVGNSDIWAPYQINPNFFARNLTNVTVFGRIKQGVTLAQAQSEMDAIAARLREENLVHKTSGLRIRAVPLHHDVVKNVRPALFMLLCAVGFVLLIACGNVANLLLARATAREREIAIRSALGASRSRIIRQILTESLLLSLMGGVLGLVLAHWGLDLLLLLRPSNLPRLDDIRLDSTALGYTFVACLVTTILFGLAPALQAAQAQPGEALKQSGKAQSNAHNQPLRRLLVISEIALSLVLLIGAGLFIRSFAAIQQVRPGFDAENVTAFQLSLPNTTYKTPQDRLAFYEKLETELKKIPGVKSVGAVSKGPLSGSGPQMPYGYNEETAQKWESLSADWRTITPDYLPTMGIKLVGGRNFTAQDDLNHPQVLIIDELLAKRAWPGENAVGKKLLVQLFTPGGVNERQWIEVIGVTEHVRIHDLTRDGREQMYTPFYQLANAQYNVMVKTDRDINILGSIKDLVKELNSDLPVSSLQPMSAYVTTASAHAKFTLILIGIFGAIALILSTIGLYGTISYTVSQRTQEIGIRMALGAQQHDIFKMIIQQGMRLTMIGIGIGLVSAYVLTHLLGNLLFGVKPGDPITFFTTTLILSLVALLACYIPARRATKVDPMVALRYE